MIKINLLPVAKKKVPALGKARIPKLDLKKIKLPVGWIVVGLVLIGISLAIMALINLRFQQRTQQIQMDIAEMQRKIEAFNVDIMKIEEAKRVKGELFQKIEIIRGLKESQRGPVRMMAALSDSTPQGLWLSDLRPVGESVYNIGGYATQTKSIVTFINNISKSPYFYSVELVGLSQATLPNYAEGIQQFTLNARIKYREEEGQTRQ